MRTNKKVICRVVVIIMLMIFIEMQTKDNKIIESQKDNSKSKSYNTVTASEIDNYKEKSK